MEPSDDVLCSLSNIKRQLSSPLYQSFLEIQEYKFLKSRSDDWICDLECLYITPDAGRKRRYGNDGNLFELEPQRKVLRRCEINPFKQGDYIVVSWVWQGEDGESDKKTYMVESRHGDRLEECQVRDVVMERVVKYSQNFHCAPFWIDQICINQGDKEELEDAMQSMDLVYRLSSNSIAIINRHIDNEEDLRLLIDLMEGKCIAQEEEQTINLLHKFARVLKLIHRLTTASWFNRAWTFHEDYKAGVKMTLLISHDPALERLKLKRKSIFGDIFGELCVNSADFRTEVTRFCQAYQRTFKSDQENTQICKDIVEIAGKYAIRLREKDEYGDDVIRKPMTPTILADIGARGITKPLDRLAIAANCCDYDTRLDTKELEDHKFSISLAILAQYILNGEIIDNSRGDDRLLQQNIFNFLKNQCLKSFISPLTKELTFIKSCRFPKVRLEKRGVVTSGHLWKIGKAIRLKHRRGLPWEDSTYGGLQGRQRSRLKHLAYELETGVHGGVHRTCYKKLAKELYSYLEQEKWPRNTFSKDYKYWMANEACHAMDDPGKVLRLGCLVDGCSTKHSSYSGIFICDRDDQELTHIFTAWRGPDDPDTIPKHVSMEVDLLDTRGRGLPRLITKKWVNGLCFTTGESTMEVLFPWPRYFR
ncbi:heterokaryon incompatibility protein-domain-containing protein [Xylogone sp. PMI_703]|nr:heterokaryon incompatibility protein-domain-containing protein [Xylogone sp. PMI_703]